MYATQQDVIDTYGQEALTVAADRDGDGVADPGVADKALADASELMDSYLGKRYDLPLPTVPEVLKPVCVDIALYRMSQGPATLTDEIKDRYRAALRWLERVADGKVSLGLPDSPPSAGGGVHVESAPRQFTRANLKGL